MHRRQQMTPNPKRRPQEWQSKAATKMMCNPIYTSIKVHPALIEDRPRDYDRALFLNIAHRQCRELGSVECIRNLLKALKEPDEWSILVPIAEQFSSERKPIMSEEEFIQAGKKIIQQIGVEGYFNNVIENLGQNIIPYGYQEAPPGKEAKP